MARITYNIELDSKPDRNGLTAVMVRLHQKGQKPARLLTSVKLERAERHWVALDKKRTSKKPLWGNWVKGYVNNETINQSIATEHKRIVDACEGFQADEVRMSPDEVVPGLTPTQLAQKFKTRLSEDYFDLTALVMEATKAMAFRTYASRETALSLLKEYAGTLSLHQLTTHYVERFQDYLRKEYVSKKTKTNLSASSINQYMNALNTVHVEVLRLKGHSKQKASRLSPFTDVDKLPSKSAYRAKFDEGAIEALHTTTIDSTHRVLPPKMAFSLWLLSHLLAGIRFTDLLLLRYGQFDCDADGLPIMLTYTMQKTANVVRIPIFEEAQTVLDIWWKKEHKPDDFVLPYLKQTEKYAQYTTRDAMYKAPFAVRRQLDNHIHYWNMQINQRLAELQAEAGLKVKLRMHNARHSFADLARRIMQEDGTLTLLDITRMLGQRDPRMVMTYIEEMENQDSTKSMQSIFKRKKKTPESSEG